MTGQVGCHAQCPAAWAVWLLTSNSGHPIPVVLASKESTPSAGPHMTQSRNCLPLYKGFPADMCKHKSVIQMYIISLCDFLGRPSYPYVLTTSPGNTRICWAHVYSAHQPGCMPPSLGVQGDQKSNLTRSRKIWMEMIFHSHITLNSIFLLYYSLGFGH